MTALAHEGPEAGGHSPSSPSLDEVLWDAWKAMDLPEGFRAEIIEGSIEVSPTGRLCHGEITHRLYKSLDRYLEGSGFDAYRDINVIHELKSWVPDTFIAPANIFEQADRNVLGVEATKVELIVEVVSPGRESTSRDRIRKRREYARAGVPVYVIIDDHDGRGTVTVLTDPAPGEAIYAAETRVPYGTPVTIPEGPAKGFTITQAFTGPRKNPEDLA